jgi:hypothetical protein
MTELGLVARVFIVTLDSECCLTMEHGKPDAQGNCRLRILAQ